MPRAGQEYVTTAEIRELNTRGVEEGQTLSLRFDNAAQTATLFPEFMPQPKIAKAVLNKMFDLGGDDSETARKMLSDIGNYHGHNISRFSRVIKLERGTKPGKLPREETHVFYSLIYHILGDGPERAAQEGRATIKEAFEVMHMGEPLSIDELKSRRSEIEGIIKPKQRNVTD